MRVRSTVAPDASSEEERGWYLCRATAYRDPRYDHSALRLLCFALLIAEAFLANVLIFAQLDPVQRWYGVLLGVGMFVLVVVIVALLVWFKPQNLTFDKTAHLMDRGKVPWGTDQAQVSPDKLFPPTEKETKP